jgi:hypothetical protein
MEFCWNLDGIGCWNYLNGILEPMGNGILENGKCEYFKKY